MARFRRDPDDVERDTASGTLIVVALLVALLLAGLFWYMARDGGDDDVDLNVPAQTEPQDENGDDETTPRPDDSTDDEPPDDGVDDGAADDSMDGEPTDDQTP